MPGEGRNDIGDTRLLVESDDGLMSEVSLLLMDLVDVSEDAV